MKSRTGPRLAAGLIAGTLVGALAFVASCGDAGPTAPKPPTNATSYAGFDISGYPGDAAMQAWKYPTSPFTWVGYYFPAPCHRDTTWSGKRATIASMGWGTAAIYVGQQDWTQILTRVPDTWMPALTPGEHTPLSVRALADLAPGSAPIEATSPSCSSSLLTIPEGTSEATDAADKMAANGYPTGSVVYLDVEYVRTVSPQLLAYYRAWLTGILADGRYRAGVYMAKTNAQILHDAAVDVYKTAGRADTPIFWIAGSNGFTTSSDPTDIGLSYASLWQGLFDVSRFYGGWSLTIDLDVASSADPSAPPTVVAADR